MRIAVDAAGGDFAPREIIKGAVEARIEYNIDITLVGRKDILHLYAGRQLKKHNIRVVDAQEVIDFCESPVRAVRSKPDSSIVRGVKLIKEGEADAFVSAGNSGAVVCAALLTLGRKEGIERPAIGSVLDITPTMPVLLVDAGANTDCRPHHLIQFAEMGSEYVQKVMKVESPRVGLLCNGEEPGKGNLLTRETYQLLKESGLNFIGNVEGHDIMVRTADVVVTDGFTGNVVLKTIEGVGDALQHRWGQMLHTISSNHQFHGNILFKLVGLSAWSKKMDYQEYGGACLLGVNGTVLIAHGRSSARAIKNAIALAEQTAKGFAEEQQHRED